jgi:hypothetical protein
VTPLPCNASHCCAAADMLPAEQLRSAACLAAAAPAAEHGQTAGRRKLQGSTSQADSPKTGQVPASREDIAAACGWDAAAGRPAAGNRQGSAIDGQHLFSVYVHAPPNVTGESRRCGWHAASGERSPLLAGWLPWQIRIWCNLVGTATKRCGLRMSCKTFLQTPTFPSSSGAGSSSTASRCNGGRIW